MEDIVRPATQQAKDTCVIVPMDLMAIIAKIQVAVFAPYLHARMVEHVVICQAGFSVGVPLVLTEHIVKTIIKCVHQILVSMVVHVQTLLMELHVLAIVDTMEPHAKMIINSVHPIHVLMEELVIIFSIILLVRA